MPKELKHELLQSVVKTIDGENMFYPIKTGVPPVPLTYRLALRVALTGDYRAEAQFIDGDTKFRRFDLARKIHNADEDLMINDSDFDEIKRCVGFAWGPEVIGHIYETLSLNQKT